MAVRAREVIGEYLAAMERGDREAAVALYAADVVMHVPGRSAFAGERRGREAVLAYLRAALELAVGGVEVELVDLLVGDGDRVALLLRERLPRRWRRARPAPRERLHHPGRPDRRDPHLRA